jgi:malonyl-CoA decarboxylase
MPSAQRSPGPFRGAAALVALRARLLQQLERHPSWAATEARVASGLRALFTALPPHLRRIEADTSPAILEQIVRCEAVHTIHSASDLRRRLQDDRRCYALFSAALPEQPLVFIEIAFTRGLCGDVTALLDTQSPIVDPTTCDCAMFYSISSCHDGLRGIPFGNTLIRLAVERLRHELPGLTTFSTVSPVPGFRAWVTALAERQGGALAGIVATLDAGGWTMDPDASRRLEDALLPLCAAYLLGAKRGAEPLDPVARFHLANGARLEQINWLGDRSDAGFRRSAGIVANYLYDLPSVDTNRDTYSATHSVIVAPGVESLARLAA